MKPKRPLLTSKVRQPFPSSSINRHSEGYLLAYSVSLFLSAVLYQNTIDDHQRILDAIESGNKDAAFSYMTIHLSTTLDDMALLKGKYPEYFE